MIFVTGSNGQLGFEVCKRLKELNKIYYPITRNDFDLVNKNDIFEFFRNRNVYSIIHCAAYTNVDKAENERLLCKAINYDATKILLDISKSIGCKFIYISTDYVFDGKKGYPYEIFDSVNPINYYGLTKAMSEDYIMSNYDRAYVIRTSSVYGLNGKNFIKTILKISQDLRSINLVCDQIVSPSYANHLARGILNILDTDCFGIYHLTNEGYCNIYDFMNHGFKKLNLKVKSNKIYLKDYNSIAQRGLNLSLSNKCLTDNKIPRLPNIYEGLNDFLVEMGYSI